MTASSSRRLRTRPGAIAACAAAAALLSAGTAEAELRVTAAPVLGPSTPANGTWLELGVRIDNDDQRPVRGTVELTSPAGYGSDDKLITNAPFAVGAGATATVRMPTRGAPAGTGQMTLRVLGERGESLSVVPVTVGGEPAPFLLDTSEPPRLAGATRDLGVPITFDPKPYSGAPSRKPGLLTGAVRTDPATGDPVLPERAVGYGGATLVVMRSDQLARLAGLQLDALANYVIAGGSLAVFITRPEDLRSATLTSLVGGEVSTGPVPSELKRTPAETPEYQGGVPGSGSGSGSGGSGGSPGKRPKAGPKQVWPGDEVGKALTGYGGGNLVPSLYGAAASYGLGEVHLLAFDPSVAPGVDDPWVKARMVDLVAHAWDRRASLVARHGSEVGTTDLTPIRKELDPNENSRWAIIVAAVLLTAYSVIAGPLNFMRASKKHRPLRALVHMPIYAAVALALVVLLGIGAKGWTGKARHLSFVDAAAGMSKGSARRFRGFFTSQSRSLAVRASDASSVIDTAIEPRSGASRSLIVEREALRLVGVSTMPWETVVLREDGFVPLGAGVSIVKDVDGVVVVANRTARDLRGVVLVTPAAASGARNTYFFDRVRDGARVKASEGKQITSFTPWSSGTGGLQHSDLSPLRADLDGQSRGLFTAWVAMAGSFGNEVDWFPEDVPVVLAQIDGGEGQLSDSGLALDRDRLLLRVVGWGGLP